MEAWEIVVTREVEWDDNQRNKLLGLAAYEGTVCSCGFSTLLTSDTDNHFTFGDRLCPVCKVGEQYARIQADADEHIEKSMGKDIPPATPRPADGRHSFARLLTPDEVQAKQDSK